MSLLIQPVLHAEAGDFLEVHEVAAEEEGVVGDADCGDFEVHRADADALGLESVENVCSVGIKRENGKLRERFYARLEAGVGSELCGAGCVAADEGDPSLERFFGGDDAGEEIGISLAHPCDKPVPARGCVGKFGEVVGVEDYDHVTGLWRFRISAILHRAEQLRGNARRPASCRMLRASLALLRAALFFPSVRRGL